MVKVSPWLSRRGHASFSFLLIAVTTLAVVTLTVAPTDAGTPPFATAPDFTTVDVAGANRALSGYLNAKPILLEFMSPDCPHCVEMAPILTRVHTAYGEKIQFLTVAFDKSVQRLQRFAQSEKHPWPYLVGTQQIINAYQLEGVPTLYFLAPDGRVISSVVGSMPEKALREKIDALLKAR